MDSRTHLASSILRIRPIIKSAQHIHISHNLHNLHDLLEEPVSTGALTTLGTSIDFVPQALPASRIVKRDAAGSANILDVEDVLETAVLLVAVVLGLLVGEGAGHAAVVAVADGLDDVVGWGGVVPLTAALIAFGVDAGSEEGGHEEGEECLVVHGE
jgi:hypothetical protein